MKYFWRVYRSDGGIDDIDVDDVQVVDQGTLTFYNVGVPEVIMAPGTWLRVVRVVEVEKRDES